jgi:hypothetical protein
LGPNSHTFETILFFGKALHVIILYMAASIQGAHPTSLGGLGVSLSHALSIITLHVSTLNKEESKYLFRFEDSISCPQIVKTKGEWFESLRIDVATSIRPHFVSKS